MAFFNRYFTDSECLSYCNHNEPAPPGAKTFRCFPRSKSVVLNVIQINLNDNITSVFHVNQVLTDKKNHLGIFNVTQSVKGSVLS